mmetsp:Transcript_70401/g.211737  ORF Transcript_70401/g.211737 Transcript_70401/m.211737 type:complete len:241 (-) Transcript_70401:1086-1808(-)
MGLLADRHLTLLNKLELRLQHLCVNIRVGLRKGDEGLRDIVVLDDIREETARCAQGVVPQWPKNVLDHEVLAQRLLAQRLLRVPLNLSVGQLCHLLHNVLQVCQHRVIAHVRVPRELCRVFEYVQNSMHRLFERRQIVVCVLLQHREGRWVGRTHLRLELGYVSAHRGHVPSVACQTNRQDGHAIFSGLENLQEAPWTREHSFGRQKYDDVALMDTFCEERAQVGQSRAVEVYRTPQHLA